MENVGVVLKIKRNKAIIFTGSSEFINIHRNRPLSLGEQIEFSESDIIKQKKDTLRLSYIAACIAALVFIIPTSIHNLATKGVLAIIGDSARVDQGQSTSFAKGKIANDLDVNLDNEKENI